MRTNGHFQVFLSYAQSDAFWARKLTEQWSAAGWRVFDPASELLPGDNWLLEIGKALDRSQAMVVLVSPEAVDSSWVKREIQYALGAERFQDRLIPVEIEPTEDFPWILRRLRWVKGTPREAGQQIARILEGAGAPGLHADPH